MCHVLVTCTAVAFVLSMFMSNTASAVALMPNAMSIIVKIEEAVGRNKESANVAKALVFGVAFMASVGGTGTIIGTPPNAIVVEVIKKVFPDLPQMSFLDWFKLNFPVALLVSAVIYLYLAYVLCPSKLKSADEEEMRGVSPTGAVPAPPTTAVVLSEQNVFATEYKQLGPICQGEIMSAAMFGVAILLWYASRALVSCLGSSEQIWISASSSYPDGLVCSLFLNTFQMVQLVP